MEYFLEPFRKLFSNEIEYIFYITVLLISSWLFIDNKRKIEDTEVEKIKKIDHTIENYYKLMCYIKSNKTDDVKNNINSIISTIIPNVSSNFSEQLMDWESADLDKLHDKLRENIRSLKRKQDHNLLQEEVTVINFTKDLIYKSGLKILFTSAINVFIALLILNLLFLSIVNSFDKTFFQIIYFHIPFIYIAFVISLLAALFDDHMLKKEDLNKLQWILLYLIILFPFVSILKFDLFKNNLRIGILAMILHLIAIILSPLLKKHFLKLNNRS